MVLVVGHIVSLNRRVGALDGPRRDLLLLLLVGGGGVGLRGGLLRLGHFLGDGPGKLFERSLELGEGGPLGGEGVPASLDDPYQLPGHVRGDGGTLVPDSNRVDHLVVVLVGPRQLASVHLPEHDAEAVQVNLFADRLVSEHLRGLVCGCAGRVAHRLHVGCVLEARQAEVAQLHLALLVDKKAVLRLQIPVHNVALVEVRHGVRDPHCDLHHLPVA
mmetsp:Transcript_33274/g.77870  ORF Transcript_33274/g.77870 Transcript_33274/m.77870 type:complete len:217 (+) Transcript_33274:68-718(+)